MAHQPMHIINADIWTANSSRPRAGSITIADGRVATLDSSSPASVSTDSDCPPRLSPPLRRVINLGGRFVMPGMIDSHVHLLQGGQMLGELDLSHVTCRDQFEQAIADEHARLPDDRWLIGHCFSLDRITDGTPDRTWLRAAGDRPVVCHTMDLHSCLVNDAVIDMVSDCASDPPGGRIERDEQSGKPTGLFIEGAAWSLINPLIPQLDATTGREALIRAQRHCHSLGLTAVGSMEYGRLAHQVIEPARDELTLRMRITLLDRSWPLDMGYGRQFNNDDVLAVIGYKTFIDGSLGSRTALMHEPYIDQPDNRGLLIELARDGVLGDWARCVAEAGFSPSAHAIGDAAITRALDAFDGVAAKARPRIEHVQHIDRRDIERFAGRIASMQPIHMVNDGPVIHRLLGEQRTAGSYALRSLQQAGAVLALGSDWPVATCDPLQGIQAAVTRQSIDGEFFVPDERIDIESALRGYTRDAAYALSSDDLGVLRPEACADIVVLDRSPFDCNWLGDDRPRVIATIVAGELVWHDADADLPAELTSTEAAPTVTAS